MIKKIDFSEGKPQFLLGFLVNVLFLAVLYCFDSSYANVQIPIGEFENNIWNCSDVPSYIQPAFNFLERGVFGVSDTPDYFRTIGYPSLISFFFYIFGSYGLLAMQIFQALIFALIYPLVTATVRLIFKDTDKKYLSILFFSLLISGAYFTRTPVLLTDTIFTLFFMAGFYFGLLYFKNEKKSDLIIYIVIITAAALIRPTLSLFPLLNIVMAYWVSKRFEMPFRKMIVKSIALSLLFLVTINISSFRNYHNHSFFSPSSVIGINAFHYLGKKVLLMEGQEKEFASLEKKIDSLTDINEKTALRKKVMFDAVMKYPVSTVKVLLTNTVNVLFAENLLANTSYFFNYGWKEYKNACTPITTTPFLFYSTYLIMFFYFVLWAAFCLQMYLFLKQRNFEMILVLLMLIGMFILPAILTGDGGGRFRLPFEHILFIFSIYYLLNRFKTIKK